MRAQAANALFGIWLIVAPAGLGYGGAGAIAGRVVGPLAATTGMVAAWGAMRPLGRLNLVLGVSLIAAPWIAGFAPDAAWNSAAVGVALAVFAAVDGRARHGFDGGWSVLVRRPRTAGLSDSATSRRNSAAWRAREAPATSRGKP